jgi:hypothetical protein
MKPSTFIVLLAIVVTSRNAQADEMETEQGSGDARHQLLASPFAVPRANYFYTALEVPEFDSARTLERGRVYARLRTAHASSSNERTVAGYE